MVIQEPYYVFKTSRNIILVILLWFHLITQLTNVASIHCWGIQVNFKTPNKIKAFGASYQSASKLLFIM
jgi:hypothetical protein